MNLAAISGGGWMQYQEAAHALLFRLAATRSTDTVLLDFDTIRREAMMGRVDGSQAERVMASHLPGYVPFATWMKDARLADDVIDTHAILRTALMIAPENIVIIDARNYDLEPILMALEKVRLAWFPLDTWHPTFAVISDDVYSLRLLTALARTFYLQPQVLSERETRLIVRGLMRRALVYRWFGPGTGRLTRVGSKMLGGFKAYLDKLSDSIHGAPKS
jgi:hypothetical protein